LWCRRVDAEPITVNGSPYSLDVQLDESVTRTFEELVQLSELAWCTPKL
jgi:hypothetical protein